MAVLLLFIHTFCLLKKLLQFISPVVSTHRAPVRGSNIKTVPFVTVTVFRVAPFDVDVSTILAPIEQLVSKMHPSKPEIAFTFLFI